MAGIGSDRLVQESKRAQTLLQSYSMDRLKVAVCTWNVAGNSTSAPNADLDEWLHLEEKPGAYCHLLEVLDINNPLSYGQQVRSSCRVAVDVCQW